jgi:hypothetical protein
VTVTSGTPVTLTAVAEPNVALSAKQKEQVPDFPTGDARFVRWSRFDCPGTGACTFIPDVDGEWVTALFTPLELAVGINGGSDATEGVKVLMNGSLQTLKCDVAGVSTRAPGRHVTGCFQPIRRSCSLHRRCRILSSRFAGESLKVAWPRVATWRVRGAR